jgi:hypothetical protein
MLKQTMMGSPCIPDTLGSLDLCLAATPVNGGNGGPIVDEDAAVMIMTPKRPLFPSASIL